MLDAIKSKNKKKSEILIVAEQLEKMYDFRYNTIKGIVEYSKSGKSEYEVISDYFINSLSNKIQNKFIKCSTNLILQILNSDLIDRYDPFESYFNGLPKWDVNKQSEISRLAKTIKTTNQLFFEKCLKRWLIAMVASIKDEKIVNQQMMVLSGKQGVGKSTWIDKLVPNDLKDYYYSGVINPNNKDTSIFLSESLLINLDELSNLNRKESSNLKEIITKENINVRKAYAKFSKLLPRRASFIGSINDSEFLWDSTGSRRFLCFNVERIDYNHKLNMNLVYSEALFLLKNGEKYFFDRDDIAEIEENNEEFKVKSVYEEKISRMLRNKKTTCQTTERSFEHKHISRIYSIYLYLYDSRRGEPTTSNLVGLGKTLTKMGFESVKKGGKKHYVVYSNSEKYPIDYNHV